MSLKAWNLSWERYTDDSVTPYKGKLFSFCLCIHQSNRDFLRLKVFRNFNFTPFSPSRLHARGAVTRNNKRTFIIFNNTTLQLKYAIWCRNHDPICKVHLKTIRNGELSDSQYDSINRGVTLVRLSWWLIIDRVALFYDECL